MENKELLGQITLSNGRRYLITDTGLPYEEVGSVERGGFLVRLWHANQWVYLCNSPNVECLQHTFRALARLEPLKDQ